ncbi:unnamed protein product [Cyprideis torosa]|uniref:Uncharacterized protein n=1 Tax=Cyprideis torosa TaxID=163714 RepID=A0A7R8WPJ5_9CRUS|nr:unnamed protein product [Cyprideis torosa]CAG0906973.1 unnamed protein product [Cyprideis torosa]
MFDRCPTQAPLQRLEDETGWEAIKIALLIRRIGITFPFQCLKPGSGIVANAGRNQLKELTNAEGTTTGMNSLWFGGVQLVLEFKDLKHYCRHRRFKFPTTLLHLIIGYISHFSD